MSSSSKKTGGAEKNAKAAVKCGGEGKKQDWDDLKAILSEAAPQAVRLLIEMVKDEEIKPELRIKCAESILERVYGKGAQPPGGAEAFAGVLPAELDAGQALKELGYERRG